VAATDRARKPEDHGTSPAPSLVPLPAQRHRFPYVVSLVVIALVEVVWLGLLAGAVVYLLAR
jgi:hypothetical protein